MKNLKEAERAAAEEENSDVEAHLTISRQDVYNQVKKGFILNDKRTARNCSAEKVSNGVVSSHECKTRSGRTNANEKGKELRRSPRSPVKGEEPSKRRKLVRGSGDRMNGGDTLSPNVRRRIVRK